MTIEPKTDEAALVETIDLVAAQPGSWCHLYDAATRSGLSIEVAHSLACALVAGGSHEETSLFGNKLYRRVQS